MPIIIDGYLVASTKRLNEHLYHDVTIVDKPLLGLYCNQCPATIAEYAEPEPSLPCGCRDQGEHSDGLRLQAETRRQVPKIPKGTCVGCFIGDDGPSMHDCYIHRA